jgi:hypothetical protein
MICPACTTRDAAGTVYRRAKTLFQLYVTALVANLTINASSEAYGRAFAFLIALLMLFIPCIVIRKFQGSLQRVFHKESHQIANINVWPRFIRHSLHFHREMPT